MLGFYLFTPASSRSDSRQSLMMNPTGDIFPSLRGRIFIVCGFSIEEHMSSTAPCAIMWSLPVCACCTDAANVYRAGVVWGF